MRERVAARDFSRAVVRLSNQQILRVNANTQLAILPSLVSGRPLGIEIQKGEIYLHSRGLPAEIGLITPLVTGIPRGTQFRVRVEADGTTTFTMFEGEVLLENAHGRLRIGNLEQAVVEPGRAPRKTAMIEAKSTIQWCLYYPGVLHLPDIGISTAEARALHGSITAYESGDLLGALDRWPAGKRPASQGAKIYRAMILLAVGQVKDARSALSGVATNAPGRKAIEEMIDAVNFVERDAAGRPSTASEWLAHSYYEQSRARLKEALAAARKAVALAPDSGFAATRVAELEFSFGRTHGALHELERGMHLSPCNAQAHALRGFLLADQNRIKDARSAFDEAIRLDGALGNAWLGRGLCSIRQGHAAEGRKDLQMAVILEPNRSILHSYLGKATSQIPLREMERSEQSPPDGPGPVSASQKRKGKLADNSSDGSIGSEDPIQIGFEIALSRSILDSGIGGTSAANRASESAIRDFDFAKKLDPHDPTPWLYSAVEKSQRYKFNDAIGDLQESIDLNDNRRIYRSGLLLDQDRAMRSANLASIYQKAGLNDVAVREATRAVEGDYTNPSAHLFLANSFDALRDPTRIQLRYETAWFNELLLANLLSPVGGGSLSQFVSQQEYSKLFEADGVGMISSTEWRSDGIFRENASVYGTFGNFSFAIDGSYYQQEGTRPNNRLGLSEIYGTFKYQLSPDDTLLLLTKWANQQQGDLFQTYDNQPLEPNVHFKEKQEPGLLLGGWNHRWAPGVNTLFLAGRLSAQQLLTSPATTQTLVQRDSAALVPGFLTRDPMLGDSFTNQNLANAPNAVTLGSNGETLSYSSAFNSGINPYIGQGSPVGVSTDTFDFYTLRRFELTTFELQQIWQAKYNTLLAGARWVDGTFETDDILNISRPTFSGGFTTPAASQHSETTMHRFSLYAYDYFRPVKWITLVGGVSWDQLTHPDNFRNPPVNSNERRTDKVSAKLGFTLEPSRWVRIRGVMGQSLGGVTYDESVRLEPVQIAGFDQSFRTIISESLAGSVEAPLYKYSGLAIEGQLPTHTFWGVSCNLIQEDVSRTVGVFDGYDSGVFPYSPAYFPSSEHEYLGYRETSFNASIQQLLGSEVSLSAGYRWTHSRLRSTFPDLVSTTANADQIGTGILHQVALAANWNSPTGLFARAEANWYMQKVDGANFQGGTAGQRASDFWQFNALVGYRFARNRCEISAGVLNLMNTDYKLDAITYYDTLPRERTAVLRCKLTF